MNSRAKTSPDPLTGIDKTSSTAQSARIAPLDGIRGIAALSILLWHYIPSIVVAPIGSPLGYLNRALSLCWTGVDIFFVLSGYLIGMILMRTRSSAGYFLVFYARRALRILPLYYLLVAIYAVGRLWAPHMPATLAASFSGLPTWHYLLFIQNFSMAAGNNFFSSLLTVSWSLAVEEHFYLILPLIIRWVAPQRLPLILIAAILAALLLRACMGGMARYVLLPFRMDSLLVGVMLAWCLASPIVTARIIAHRRTVTIVCCALAIVALPLLKTGWGLNALHYRWGWLLHFWVAVLTAGVLMLVLTSHPSALWLRVIGCFPFRWAGLRAYGIYLIHPWALCFSFAVFGLGRPLLTPSHGGVALLVAALATFLVAEASFRWLEQPFLRFGHRLRY